MRFADQDIEQAQRLGMINISPWRDDLLQPCSYDLTLAPYVAIQEGWDGCTCDGCQGPEGPWRIEEFDDIQPGGGTFILAPGVFMLFSTVETVTVGDSICGEVKGKSTWARRGLLVEAAGLVDPGFSGQLTLELKNLTEHPIILTAGVAIAQITFDQLRSKARRPYSTERNHYQGQRGPTPPWRS